MIGELGAGGWFVGERAEEDEGEVAFFHLVNGLGVIPAYYCVFASLLVLVPRAGSRCPSRACARACARAPSPSRAPNVCVSVSRRLSRGVSVSGRGRRRRQGRGRRAAVSKRAECAELWHTSRVGRAALPELAQLPQVPEAQEPYAP